MNPTDVPPDEDEGDAEQAAAGAALNAGAEVIGAGAEVVSAGAEIAGEIAGGAAETAGGCLEGCGGCAAAMLLMLFGAAGTALAVFR